MRRVFASVLALALLAAACGGDDDTASTTAAPQATPTTAATPTPTQPPATSPPSTAAPADNGGAGAGTEFCQAAAAMDPQSFDFSLDPQNLQTAMEQTMAAIDRVAQTAPSEVRADVELIRDGFAGFVELLEEYDYNFIAIGTQATDDPRLTRLEDDDFAAAADRIGAYCGLDINTDGGQSVTPPTGGQGGGSVPEALMPPGVTNVLDTGGGTFLISVDSTFDDMLTFYSGLLGDPLFADADQMVALWTTEFGGTAVSVSIGAAVTSTSGVEVVIALGG